MEDADNHLQQEKPSSDSKLGNLNKFKIKLKMILKQNQGQPAAVHEHQGKQEDRNKEVHEGEKEEEEIKGSSSSSSSSSDDQGLISCTRVTVCPICQKGFSSGKALGGHMRVHSEPKPYSNSTLNPNPKPTPNEFRCSLCGKEFRSQKSLFGHMRSHPDRLWRGMQPPSELNAAKAGPDSDMDDSGLGSDRVMELPCWGEKGQRGQNRQAEAAAGDLMTLVAGGGGVAAKGERMASEFSQSPILKKRGCDFDPDELYFLQNLGFFLGENNENCGGDEEGGDQASPRKEEMLVGEEVDPTRIYENPGSKPERKMLGEKNGNGKRVRNLGSIEKGEDGGRWRCSICNKTFPTHQALGGHMSSHNKEKNHNFSHNSSNALSNCTHSRTYTHVGSFRVGSRDDDIDGGGEFENEVVVNDKLRDKKCNYKNFSSSKISGGHNKCHSSSSSGQSSCQTGKKGNIFELDLNVAPPTIEED